MQRVLTSEFGVKFSSHFTQHKLKLGARVRGMCVTEKGRGEVDRMDTSTLAANLGRCLRASSTKLADFRLRSEDMLFQR